MSTCGQLRLWRGGRSCGGRVVVEQLLAPQVAVEGAQAGDLALQRRRLDRAGGRRRRWRARTRSRRGRRGRAPSGSRPGALEVRAELQQVGAVGLERVARQAALELEVGEEVEHEVLERLGSGRRWPRHGASPRAAPRRLPRCKAAFSSPRAGRGARQQRDQRLGVLRLGDHRVELRQRADSTSMRSSSSHLGALVDVREPGGEEEVDLLVGEAGRGVEGAERLPVLGLLADLLGQLALGGLQRRLALDVELAGRDLQQVGDAGRLARLADEPQRARRRARRSRPRPGGRRSRGRRPRRPRGGRWPPTVMNAALARRSRTPMRSKRELMRRRRLVEQRERDVEHPLERRRRRPARSARGCARCRWRGSRTVKPAASNALASERAAGGDPPRLVAAGAQRGLGGGDRGASTASGGSRGTSARQVTSRSHSAAAAPSCTASTISAVTSSARAGSSERASAEQPRSAREPRWSADAAVDRADVGGRLVVEAAERHRGRPRGRRRGSALRPASGRTPACAARPWKSAASR